MHEDLGESQYERKKPSQYPFLCLRHHTSHKLSVDSLCFAKGLAGNYSADIKSVYDSIKVYHSKNTVYSTPSKGNRET